MIQTALPCTEILSKIIDESKVSSQVALSHPALKAIMEQESFWQRQCTKHRYKNRIKSNIPENISQPFTYKRLYHENHITNRNWSTSKYRRWDLYTEGRICLLLDGAGSRALSSNHLLLDIPTEVWDFETQKILYKLHGEDIISAAAMSKAMLWVGKRNGALLHYDMRQNSCMDYTNVNREVSCLAVKGDTLATGSVDGLLKIWDLRSMRGELQNIVMPSPITCVAMNRHKTIACGTVKGEYYHSDCGAKTINSPINAILMHKYSIILGTDAGMFKATSNGTVAFLDSKLNSPIVSMHRFGNRLVTGKSSGHIALLNLSKPLLNPLIIQTEREPIWQVALDRSRILSTSLRHRISVLDFGPTTFQ